MKYIYIDGDNIGLQIEQSFLNNDEIRLIQVNQDVHSIIREITNQLISANHQIIFSGADGIISKSENLNISNIQKIVDSLKTTNTFSVGIGNSLQDCYIALRFAKSYSKNVIVTFLNGKFEVINKNIA